MIDRIFQACQAKENNLHEKTEEGGARALWHLHCEGGTTSKNSRGGRPTGLALDSRPHCTANKQHGVHYVSVSIKRLLIRFFEMTS